MMIGRKIWLASVLGIGIAALFGWVQSNGTEQDGGLITLKLFVPLWGLLAILFCSRDISRSPAVKWLTAQMAGHPKPTPKLAAVKSTPRQATVPVEQPATAPVAPQQPPPHRLVSLTEAINGGIVTGLTLNTLRAASKRAKFPPVVDRQRHGKSSTAHQR